MTNVTSLYNTEPVKSIRVQCACAMIDFSFSPGLSKIVLTKERIDEHMSQTKVRHSVGTNQARSINQLT